MGYIFATMISKNKSDKTEDMISRHMNMNIECLSAATNGSQAALSNTAYRSALYLAYNSHSTILYISD